MVGQHPALAGLPELKLFWCPAIGDLDAPMAQHWLDRGITHRCPGLVRALAEVLFGNQEPAALDRARAWLKARPHWRGEDVLDVLQEQLLPRTVVEKSPENVTSVEALLRLARAYPNARYLHLTRHPVTTQRSMQEHWNRTMPPYPLEGEPMAGLAAWFDVNWRIVNFCKALDSGAYLRVRAEDVLNEPDAHLRAIAEWMGIRSDAEAIDAMKHPETSRYAHLGPAGSGIVGGNDLRFLGDPVPHRVQLPSTIDQPATWRGNRFLWEAIVTLAAGLGYGDPS
jgi:hypothetical protein